MNGKVLKTILYYLFISILSIYITSILIQKPDIEKFTIVEIYNNLMRIYYVCTFLMWIALFVLIEQFIETLKTIYNWYKRE